MTAAIMPSILGTRRGRGRGARDPQDRRYDRRDRARGIGDGKGVGDHTPVDAHLTRTARFDKAIERRSKAEQDIKHEADQLATKGLQMLVIHQIDAARKEVRHVMQTVLSHG